MPLTIRKSDNVSRPVIVCDHCNAVIDSVRDGNFMWQRDKSLSNPRISFTHKACCAAFERIYPGGWLAMELPVAMLRLCNNLNFGDAEREAAGRNATDLAAFMPDDDAA